MGAKRYFVILLLVLLNLFGLMNFLVVLSGKLFLFELFVAFGLLIMAFGLILFPRDSPTYYWIGAAFFGANVLNFILIALFMYWPVVFLFMEVCGLLGFVFCLNRIERRKKLSYEQKLRAKYERMAEELEPISEEPAKVYVEKVAPEVKIEKKKRPKFVASKNGKVVYPVGHYLAKQIKRSNKVYFQTEAEAKRKGYKPLKK